MDEYVEWFVSSVDKLKMSSKTTYQHSNLTVLGDRSGELSTLAGTWALGNVAGFAKSQLNWRAIRLGVGVRDDRRGRPLPR
jgi:hypothetical protein